MIDGWRLCMRASGTPEQVNPATEINGKELSLLPASSFAWKIKPPNEAICQDGELGSFLEGNGSSLVHLEVKRAGTDLTSHQIQLLRYGSEAVVDASATHCVLGRNFIQILPIPAEHLQNWKYCRLASRCFPLPREYFIPGEVFNMVSEFIHQCILATFTPLLTLLHPTSR